MAGSARQHDDGRPGYELRDISLGPVLAVAFAIFAGLALFCVLMWWMYMALADREATRSRPAHPMAAQQARQLPPAPRLQSAPVDDLIALRQWEEEKLSGYGWVDRDAGVVRIPIERAMKLTVERGLPSRGGGASR